MMKKYFENKIGEKIKKVIKTGDDFFTKVYQRNYSIEILGIKNDVLYVEVNSYDVVPSGYRKGGSEEYFGEFQIVIGDKSKTDIMFEIIKKADPMFIREYNVKAI